MTKEVVEMARKTKEEANLTRQRIMEAARRVFYQDGVTCSSLEKVAKAAGVTRGAVYWHFKDKTELFFALREDVFAPLRERTTAIFLDPAYRDPLDALEAGIKEFFRVLDECLVLREVFEIMLLRCEYVGEFSSVLVEANRPAVEFLKQVEDAYRRAADSGTLAAGLDPMAMARDTSAFTCGLMSNIIRGTFAEDSLEDVPAIIANHVRLRRRASV